MLYILYRIGFFLARIMPLKACYFAGSLVAWVYFLFAEKDKEILRENLRMVLGKNTDADTIDKHVLEVFKNFAKYLADFFRFPRVTEDYVFENIEIEGREHMDACLAEGNGVILLSLHLGNWELGGAVVAALKYPISAIVLKHANKRINDFFTRQRSINNLKAIPVGLQIKECFRVLRKNEALAIAGDKDYTSGGIYVDFFGRKAVMPKGPAVFSLKTSAPIVVCVLTRKKDDTFRFCFEEPIRYEPTGEYDKDVRALMEKYLAVFEKHIRENPDQWYAFKKIWVQE
ncbi:MAG: lysophospholipid acyltransferase family protein [Candidatus Omnitrophota bacterium]